MDWDWKALQAPFAKNEVQTRNDKGKAIKYITARQVMNRLDKIVGPQNWKTEYRIITPGIEFVECTLYLFIDGEWVGKSDLGDQNTYSPEKSAYSDALKRAAVMWGIGRELYEEGVVNWDNDAPAERPQARKTAPRTGATPAPRVNTPEQGAQYVTYDNWPAMRDWLIGAQLADNETHAYRRMCRVLDIDENAEDAWRRVAARRVTSKELYALFVARKAEKQAEEG